MRRRFTAVAVLLSAFVWTVPGLAATDKTAWEAIQAENPALMDDGTIGPVQRALLQALTLSQYDAFLDGADPRSLVLASGETLAGLLHRLAAKGAVAVGLVYYPVANCAVVHTPGTGGGKLDHGEVRTFLVRGLAADLSAQGGSATGCGVPPSAEAIVANLRVFAHSGNGKLKAAASDQSLGATVLIRYDEPGVASYSNATVLDLCLAAGCASDFQVRAQGAGSRTHLAIDVVGYFAPLGDGGLTTTGTTTTEALTITGLDCTANTNNGALTTDASGVVSCSDDDSGASGNTLDAAYDQGGAGAGRMVTADSGAVQIAGSGGLEIATGSLLQTPGNPTLTGSLSIGTGPQSVFVSGRYAYVVDLVSDDLKVIDASDPSSPRLVGSLGIGATPVSVAVSGRYAYVVDVTSDDLKVIDVSDPSSPSLAGSLLIASIPTSVSVSGRYAYVVDVDSDDLKVIDVSDPSSPSQASSTGLGTSPQSVTVSGRYAYVVDNQSDDLKVIDVSDPSSPSLVGSLGIGTEPVCVTVSGRYVYVVDSGSDDLKVIDVSDPSAPGLAGSLGLERPRSVYVSGRYTYVVDTDELKVIDVSDPSSPSLVASLPVGPNPNSVYVSGRYAYVVDPQSIDLKVIDVSGAEVTSLIAHSMEAGNLQVRNDVIAQGQLQVAGGVNVGSGGVFSDGDVGVAGDVNITGNLNISGACTGCASDRNLKRNVHRIGGSLEKISALNSPW